MKVTAPQMGILEIALDDLFKRLGVEFVKAPQSSQEALEIGSRLGPELACLPLKITLGNLALGLKKGANAIVMAGGIGPCRFGYYGQIQRIILEKCGLNFKTIIIEPPSAGLSKFIASFKELAPNKSTLQIYKIIKTSFQKLRALDFVEKKSLQIRAYEVNRGDTTKARKKALKIISAAQTKSEIMEAGQAALKELDQVSIDPERDVLKVGLVGEFYLLLEPFANFDIEQYLGHQGIYVERGVYMSDWISPTSKNVVLGLSQPDIVKAASGYLDHTVGGEGQPTIGHVISLAKDKFDGAIHLFPFTCMPEIIADNILPSVLADHKIALLTLVIDEQSGRAGTMTRLEAFIDLMRNRRLPRPDGARNDVIARSGATRQSP